MPARGWARGRPAAAWASARGETPGRGRGAAAGSSAVRRTLPGCRSPVRTGRTAGSRRTGGGEAAAHGGGPAGGGGAWAAGGAGAGGGVDGGGMACSSPRRGSGCNSPESTPRSVGIWDHCKRESSSNTNS